MDTLVIPVMRPRLPDADALLPYLRRIDANRWYSNFGPLGQELEIRLAEHWRVGPGCVLPLVNATLGLAVALTACGAESGSLCLMPSWSFVATAHAAGNAGLVPFFADVDAASGALTPDIAAAAVDAAPGPVGAVMPVYPFGAPIDVAGWERFRRRTGIPVVIDAAAAFDSLRPSELPQVVSLHATKVFPAGEGAVLVCPDATMVAHARRRANFGFLGNHQSLVAATNAKMSEYHAAVALASLDLWPATRAQWRRVLERLRAATAIPSIAWPAGLGRDYVCSSPALRVADAAATVNALRDAGVDSRQWWQGGIHSHPAFATRPSLPLPVSESLARTTVSIPCWLDMEARTIDLVAATLCRHAGG